MNRYRINIVVDTLAFVAFVFLLATGLLMRLVLPPGSGHFNLLWGMDRHDWGYVHFAIAMVLAGAMALHIIFHWSWIVCATKGSGHKGATVRVAIAVVGLLVVLGFAVSPFLGQVERGGEPPHKIQAGQQPKAPMHEIKGSMTLREVEQQTGVPAEAILRQLGLPADLPTDERLGRLRKKYDFQMHDLQKIVQKHQEGEHGRPMSDARH